MHDVSIGYYLIIIKRKTIQLFVNVINSSQSLKLLCALYNTLHLVPYEKLNVQKTCYKRINILVYSKDLN